MKWKKIEDEFEIINSEKWSYVILNYYSTDRRHGMKKKKKKSEHDKFKDNYKTSLLLWHHFILIFCESTCHWYKSNLLCR